VNERTGRTECVFVDLEAVYPENDPSAAEYCFEELRAKRRGWLDYDWAANRKNEQERQRNEIQESIVMSTDAPRVQTIPVNLDPHGSDAENIPPGRVENQQKPIDHARRARKEDRANRTRKIKVMEVKQEPQTGLYKSTCLIMEGVSNIVQSWPIWILPPAEKLNVRSLLSQL
jgi:checkpoint serine/threonine-protein kinase